MNNELYQVINQSYSLKSQLVEDQTTKNRWEKTGLLEGLSPQDKIVVAKMLNNQAQNIIQNNRGLLSEQATAVSGGQLSMLGGQGENWAGIVLPTIRRIFNDMSTKEFVSVQPLNLPSGLVFYLDFQYATSKDGKAGQSVFGVFGDKQFTTQSLVGQEVQGGLYGAGKFGYSLNEFSGSVSANVSAATLADFGYDSRYSSSIASGNYTKISVTAASLASAGIVADNIDVKAFNISGSIAISGSITSSVSVVSTQPQFTTISSDINGNFAGYNFIAQNQSPFTGSYTSSASTLTFFYNKKTNPAQRADYEDSSTFAIPNSLSSSSIKIPEFNIKLVSTEITVKNRKLKASWSPEDSQDLNAYQNIDVEAELTGLLSNFISMEIDLETFEMLLNGAASVGYWSAKNNNVWNGSSFVQTSANDSGFYNQQGTWFQTLGTTMNKISNDIYQKTFRGRANFIVTSPQVATIFQSIPGFASNAGDNIDKKFSFGVRKEGTLNSTWQVYVVPYWTNNVILTGYKGNQFLESGAVYAPYIPILMTPIVMDPETFSPRKGVMSRYALKMLRPEFYGKVFVHGLETFGYAPVNSN